MGSGRSGRTVVGFLLNPCQHKFNRGVSRAIDLVEKAVHTQLTDYCPSATVFVGAATVERGLQATSVSDHGIRDVAAFEIPPVFVLHRCLRRWKEVWK